ncbi:hypothetical protein D6T65_04985 [Arthrobacter frigidicola]|nr:hypothetical protein D6T65_04985 [Arthrobacter frigidicola]
MSETKIPAGVKKPSDRQTAKSDVVSKKSKFDWRGTEYTVDPDLIDDLEFFEALEGNQFATALQRMLGAEQYDKFKAQVKEAEGRVSLATTQAFLEEYMGEAQRGK